MIRDCKKIVDEINAVRRLFADCRMFAKEIDSSGYVGESREIDWIEYFIGSQCDPSGTQHLYARIKDDQITFLADGYEITIELKLYTPNNN
jgi:hypothetical protein